MARRVNITDRALRYRAVKNHPSGGKQCAFCGSKRTVEVGHVNGHEEDTDSANLIWTCRSCNVLAGNSLRSARMGRLTNQYNPPAGGGAKTLAQWLAAVSVITPHKDRGQGSLFPTADNTMAVSDAVAMIRATPASRRSSFAREIAGYRRSRADARWNPCKRQKNMWPFSPSLSARQTTPATGGIAAHAGKGSRTRVSKGRASSYKGHSITLTSEGSFRAMDSEFDSIKDAKRFIDAWTKRNPAKWRREMFATKAEAIKRWSELEPQGYTAFEIRRKQKAPRHYEMTYRLRNDRRKNPSDASASAYEDFHGKPSAETITVKRKIHHHAHLAAAGQLRMLKVEAIDGKHLVTIRFNKGTVLAFNEDRNQLFVEGGDQSVNVKDFGISKAHELETLGRVTDIDYFTSKDHLGSEGGTAVYRHQFRTTNEEGKHVTLKVARCPDLIYRVRDQQLEFSGGSYEILAEGIDR